MRPSRPRRPIPFLLLRIWLVLAFLGLIGLAIAWRLGLIPP
ncbi:hypothetical protein [Labrys okinawensis]|nr:hypothetical protein [Labrys okinawensis]